MFVNQSVDSDGRIFVLIMSKEEGKQLERVNVTKIYCQYLGLWINMSFANL